MDALACAAASRRFAGRLADEFAILCRPQDGSGDPARQAEEVYRSLAAILATQHASFRHVACETLFLRDIRRDLPAVLDIRARTLAELGEGSDAPLPRFVGQPPVDGSATFELAAAAVVPGDGVAWRVGDVGAAPSCGCDGCARTGARVVGLGEHVSLHTTNLHGEGDSAYEQAWNMFRAGERLLARCGMGFGDVVRTWIHLRDIDRDYETLNRARREFFRDRGIVQVPASTGVQGTPFPGVHDLSMCLHAVRSSGPLDVAGMSTPLLAEAWSYGADFARGLRVADDNQVRLYLSGTASIDEAGKTVHVGDFAGQAARMLDNLASLLAGQGAGVGDLLSGVVYLRHAGDAPALRSTFRERGFEGFPCALVAAPLCRPELLCEAEAVAMLPPAAAVA